MNPNLAPILDRTGHPATVAWAHDGQGDLAALPDPELAILAAERLGNAAALQGVTNPKPLRKAAAAALHRLRSRGVKVDAPPPPRAFTLVREEVNIPPRAFLSLPDDDGDMQLLLSVTDQEESCVFATIIGGADRVKEARHAHVNRSELRDIVKQTAGHAANAEIPFVAGLHYADRLLADRKEHGWKHFLEHVEPATLASARVLDPLRQLPSPRADEPEPHPWMPHASLLARSALTAGVSDLAEVVTSQLHADEDARRVAMDEVMARVSDAALDDDARARVADYLEFVVASCQLHGWPRHATAMTDLGEKIASGARGSAIPAIKASVQLHLAHAVVRMAESVGR